MVNAAAAKQPGCNSENAARLPVQAA